MGSDPATAWNLPASQHPSLGCTGAHECGDPQRPRSPCCPASEAEPARDADRPLIRDGTPRQTQLCWTQSRNASGKKWQLSSSTPQMSDVEDQWTVQCWCGPEAAGLLPSGQECWLFAATLKTPSHTVSLLSGTTACGSGDRQQPKAASSQATSPPQRDWAAAPAVSRWMCRRHGAGGRWRALCKLRLCSRGPGWHVQCRTVERSGQR